MAKDKKGRTKKAEGKEAEKRERPEGRKEEETDLAALQGPAEQAKSEFDKSKAEVEALRKKASDLEAEARGALRKAVAPYRAACVKAGRECEFGRRKAPAIAPRVRYVLERVKGGIKIAIKGRPESEETIPEKELRESVGKAAQRYMEKWVGDKAAIGNKAAGVSTRFRTMLAEK